MNCYKGNLWSVTAGIGAGGFNAYIGFASGNGMIAGLGYNFGGAGGFSTNMIGLGVNWSESGGASANMFGWQMSQSGMSFNPGVGAGITLKYGTEVVYSNLSNDVTSRKNSCFKSQQEVIDHLNEEGQGVGKNGVTSVDYENTVFPDKDNTRDADGIIRTKNGGIASAVTYLHYNGLSVTGSIFMSPHTSSSGFDVTFNHELIHLYHYNKYSGGKLVNNKLKSYSESVAHSYNQTYFQNEIAPEDYSGYGYSHTDIPNYLIPVTLPLIQQRSYWLK